MVPSLLAAFSAPTRVSVVPPSALASSAVTAAFAAVAAYAAQTRAANRVSRMCMFVSSEGGLEGEAQHAAVLQVGGEAVGRRDGGAVVLVVTEPVDVLQVEAVLLLHVGRDADRVVAEALVATERRRGVARDSDRVGHRC